MNRGSRKKEREQDLRDVASMRPRFMNRGSEAAVSHVDLQAIALQ